MVSLFFEEQMFGRNTNKRRDMRIRSIVFLSEIFGGKSNNQQTRTINTEFGGQRVEFENSSIASLSLGIEKKGYPKLQALSELTLAEGAIPCDFDGVCVLGFVVGVVGGGEFQCSMNNTNNTNRYHAPYFNSSAQEKETQFSLCGMEVGRVEASGWDSSKQYVL